jgi:hypothetical protein
MNEAQKLQEANEKISQAWNAAPEDMIKPTVMYLIFQNKWYAVVDDSSTVYIVASKDGQILAVAKSKVRSEIKHSVPIYYVEDTLSAPISPLKIISCNSIKNKKQKFVLEKIVPYL